MRACKDARKISIICLPCFARRRTRGIENLQKQNNAQQDIIEKLKIRLEQTRAERDVMRNELCYKCGNYREAHNGACNGCRWEKR